MKSLIYVIALMVITLNNTQINIEEFAKPSIETNQQFQSRAFFSFMDGTQFYYTEEYKEAFEIVLSMLQELPEEVKIGVAEIHFEGKNENIAGRTSGTTITLFDFMAYDTNIQKYILFHEVGHAYSNVLWSKGILDLDYTKYSEYAKKDKNYISSYSKGKIKENANYSEDFADAFSKYFSDNKNFKRKYKNRYEYLEKLMELARKEEGGV